MTGPKLNENVLALAEGQRSTKAVARHVRGSATKVRVVLDLIRGLDVRRADEVLQFSDRAAAAEVRNVLASAVANAIHNDNQDADELFVLAAFADEGPTLKRFRPRARGRASRIRKRTTHITVVVARMSDERLEVVQNRQTASAASRRRPGLSATSRAERVARSRQRAEGLRSGAPAADEAATDEVVADEVETDAVAADAVETDEMETDEITAVDAAAEETVTDAESADVTDAVESSSDKAETGEGSANDESQASASEPLNEDGDEPDPTTSEAQRSEEGN